MFTVLFYLTVSEPLQQKKRGIKVPTEWCRAYTKGAAEYMGAGVEGKLLVGV